MPDPPTTLSPAEQHRVGGAQRRATATASSTATAPKPTENVASAETAVTVPQAESNARAAAAIVTELGDTVKPSVEIVALCERIKTLIREKRPANEDAVVDSRPEAVANESRGAVQGDVNKNVDTAKGSYGPIDSTPKGPQPSQAPGIDPIPAAAPTPDLEAKAGTPDAIPPEQVNLDGDAQQMESKAEQAGLNKESAQLVEGGPVGEAREARGEMDDQAKNGPAEVLKQQQEALATSDANMAALQMKALQSLHDARAGHVTGVGTQQQELKRGAEDLRTRLSAKAQGIYESAQSRVQDLLRDVPTTAMDKWTKGLPPISRQFKADLKVVSDQVSKRHSGVGGFFVAGWDAVAGLPNWVKEAYDTAEKSFGDSVCTLITGISVYVNQIIKIADEIIADARTQISAVFTTELPEADAGWAAEQEKAFGAKLDALHDKAEQTRTSFNKELIDNAGNAVQAAREEIQKLRKAAGGLWGRFLNAVGRFLDNPVKFIIDGLLELVGISPPAFWGVVKKIGEVLGDIIDAPMKFANNLMDGIGQGFSQFFDNIGRHLLEGLLEWLLSGLKDEGISIQIPKEFSVKSVIGFFLQLLGISWVRIRKLLVEQLGEKAVAAIEKTAGIIATLATKGISGILDDIKQFLDPKNIVDTIVDVAVKYIAETLIVKVAVKVLAMLNPAGAILAAIEAIYRVLKWIFTNAAKIFHLVEAVVNGMADVISGNIGGVAKTVEKALAMLIAPVIDFLADYLGLGGLPGKVANAVKGLQAWVEGVMRSVIKWLVELGKKLMRALGIKGQDDKGKEAAGGLGEDLTFTEGNQTHHLYIDVKGSRATVMVSSTPMTVTAWLDHLEGRVKGSGDSEAPKGGRVLLAIARNQLAATDASADQAAASTETSEAVASTQGGASPQLAQAVDDKEHQLRDTLDKLGELFGEKPLLVKSMHISGASVDITAVPAGFTEEILGYRGRKILFSRSTGAGYVAKLLAKEGTTANFEEKSGTLELVLTTAGQLAAATSGAALGKLIADDTGIAQISLAKGETEFTVTGNIDDVGAEVAHGLLPMLPLKDVRELGEKRLNLLANAWSGDARASRLRDTDAGGKKAYLWYRRTDFDTRPEAPAAGIEFLESRHTAHNIPAQTRTEFQKLLEERGGAFKRDFQVTAGDVASTKTRDFGLKTATRERIIKAIQTVIFENNETYGSLRMPVVRPEPLPPQVRLALIAMLKSRHPVLQTNLTASPKTLTMVLPQAADLIGILQDAIDGKPPLEEAPSEDLKESLVTWKNLIVYPEMHHVVPEWLGGPAKPDVELWVPRILHNFGEGADGPGFHQILNGILKGLGFADAGDRSISGPRINDARSVELWLTINPANRIRLQNALSDAYSVWEGSNTPGLLAEISGVLDTSFKKLEQPKDAG